MNSITRVRACDILRERVCPERKSTGDIENCTAACVRIRAAIATADTARQNAAYRRAPLLHPRCCVAAVAHNTSVASSTHLRREGSIIIQARALAAASIAIDELT